MTEAPDCTFNQALLSAWQAELKATHSAIIKEQGLPQAPDLLPRFTEQYQQLKALRRRVRRGLQRQWKRSLAGLALLLALGQAPALAATINVGGTCTLVRAINAANNDTTANGNCTQGSGADTIVLPANSTQTLTSASNPFAGPSGLPVITSTMTIAGNGSTIARSSAPGTPDFRIFTVDQNGNLTLRQTTVTGGSLPADQSRGGGVYRRSGTLTLIGCTISSNSASYGGGVFNGSFSGNLTVTNSTVSENTATGSQGGGGLFNITNGILTVTNSTISGNTATFGGGLRNDGTATFTNSAISGNSASGVNARGGGMTNAHGSLTLTNSTVSGNTAESGGGGVNNYRGTVILTNSTISDNSASNSGGAANLDGKMSFVNSTVSGNAASDGSGGGASNSLGKMVFVNSTVSGNTAKQGPQVSFSRGGGVYSGNVSFNLTSIVVL
ncbi:MAG TPA: hypothetical protein VKB96_07785, partial [Gammaproteobacteria bacterium]|nr:hypothetical protein [Gammaproteobacteria bacterium]